MHLMKPALRIVVLLGLSVVLFLAGEAVLLVRGRSYLEDLRLTDQLQIQANGRLEAEINGLKLSQPRIDALFARLNESVARTKNLELNRSSTNRSLLANREATDQEPFVISRLTEMGVVTQPARVPNGETAAIYLAGSSTLDLADETAIAMMVNRLLKDPDSKWTWKILKNKRPEEFNERLHMRSEVSGPSGSPIPVDMGARFTVNVNCSQTEEEKLMPIVDGETGEPIPDGENPYGARASKNGQ
jgi:hypothetical protein